ncbi:hypothetical protein L7H89_005642 [Klebsiella pneumoniae]|nr:hypothetical protein [Klebsiella pneumoniae]
MENNDKGLVEQFMIYLYEKRRANFYFMISMVLFNAIAVVYEHYAFNLLSFFIMLIWSITLIAEAFGEKGN